MVPVAAAARIAMVEDFILNVLKVSKYRSTGWLLRLLGKLKGIGPNDLEGLGRAVLVLCRRLVVLAGVVWD